MIVALKDLTRRSVVVSPILRVLKKQKRHIQNLNIHIRKGNAIHIDVCVLCVVVVVLLYI